MQRLRRLSHTIYRLTAARYEDAIGPVMGPLARDLLTQPPTPPAGRLLDIGTGTGLLLRQAAPWQRHSVGIDLSLPMLRVAAALRQRDRWPRTSLLQADAHDLAIFRAETFDSALASFGLGECEPERALRSIRRVLRPGGMLRLQEWGPYAANDPRTAVDAALAEVILPDAAGLLADLRALLAEPLPWQAQLQDSDDYCTALEEAGLEPLDCREFQPVTLYLSVPAFLAYALAWAPRALEFAALPAEARAAFERAVTARLLAQAGPDGLLRFAPGMIRATAIRR